MKRKGTETSKRTIEAISIYPHKLFNVAAKNKLIMKEHFDIQNVTGIILGDPSFLRMKIFQSIDLQEFKFMFQMNDENNVPIEIIGLSSEYEFSINSTPKICKWIQQNFVSDIFLKYCQETINKKEEIYPNFIKNSFQYFIINSSELYDDKYLLYSEKVSNIFGYDTYYSVNRDVNEIKNFINKSTIMLSNQIKTNKKHLYKFQYLHEYEFWIKA